MAFFTLKFASAAPSGNGFQCVTTVGLVSGTCSVEGDYVEFVVKKQDFRFTNFGSHDTPVPLSPSGVGCLTLKNQYGYINYNLTYLCCDLIEGQYRCYGRVVDRPDMRSQRELAAKRW